jgi:hypothetical protein
MRLPIISSQPEERQLLIVEYSSARSRIAYFHDDQGELIFGGTAAGVSMESALDSLQNKPDKFSDIILGVPYSGLTDSSTVVKYRRNPETKISEDEIKETIAKIPPLESFFDDLFNAKIDGLPTLDPAERSGEVVELNYYQVSGDSFASVKEQVKKFGADPTIVPTAYAVAKLVSQANPKGALTFDIDPEKTEVSLTAEGHLVGIKSFDIGGSSSDLFTEGMEAALEDLKYTELWPEQVYLCGEIQNYEEFRSRLLAYPWTKKFNMMGFPKVEVVHPLSVNLTLPSDVGLNALSLLG